MARRYGRPLHTGIELKFVQLEEAFEIAYGTGRVPGTSLSRALLPEEDGGGIGWCLAVGQMSMPKSFFYSRTINGAFQKARNAARAGRIEAPTIAIIG